MGVGVLSQEQADEMRDASRDLALVKQRERVLEVPSVKSSQVGFGTHGRSRCSTAVLVR